MTRDSGRELNFAQQLKKRELRVLKTRAKNRNSRIGIRPERKESQNILFSPRVPFRCRVKIEKLNVKETADYVHIEENMYERVPLIPYLYTTEVSLHVFYELDIQRRMSHYRVKNEEGPNDFLGTRSE